MVVDIVLTFNLLIGKIMHEAGGKDLGRQI